MKKKPKIILLFDTSTMYSQGFLRGITKYSRMHGPWEFYRLLPYYRTSAEKKQELALLEDWGADGIIADQKGHKLRFRVPEIVFGEPDEKFYAIQGMQPCLPNIVTNNAAVARIAFSHLFDRGFQRFAFCGFDDMIWSRQRGENFYQEAAKRGCQCHLYNHPKSKSKKLWKNEKQVLINWLKSLPKPIGMMACSDDRGLDVLEAAKLAGLQIPDQIAVVGVDNEEMFCSLSEPSLSSIAFNTEKAGFESAELLDRLIRGEKMKGQKIVIEPTQVVTRVSTDVLAIEDRDVAEAIRFIRQRANQKIQVSDVVSAIGISRCGLYQRFFKIRGHSLYQEIIHTRMQHVAQMLLETDFSVSRIAAAMGDDNDKHISRVFRKEFGCSPQVYRKQYR